MVAQGPLRRLAAGTLISAVGNGAWYTSWAIFLTRWIGLSPATVGIGMTIAGACGVAAAMPLGWIADRIGARGMFAGLLALQGLSAGAYVLVHGAASFLIVSCIAQVAGSGTGGPRNALVLGLCDRESRLEVLGQLRSVSHIGWAVGAVAGGAVIAVATQPAYLALLALNAGTYLVYALLVITVPRVSAPASAESGRGGMRVVRDAPYMSLAGLMGVLALCWAMLSSGLPLWVTLHTHAPRAISAVVVLISSVGIAAFQVRVSREITAPRAAATGALLSGCALAASCLLFALTAGGGGAGVIVLMAAPALMTTLIAGWGQPGWIALAVIFLVPGVAALPVTRWALRTRPVTAPAPPASRRPSPRPDRGRASTA